jgi:hypothetical protein
MRYIIIVFCLTFISALFPATWIINQDGTGDFTSISEGISAAQDGDILLVYPGVYYENINYQGKNITITSLYDGDQYDESFIAGTVINGSYEGTVVAFHNNETRNAVLNGFTITNGLGSFHPNITKQRRGGGIYIRHASPIISNCRIKHNRANVGGGISLISGGNPLLKGNIISHNHANEFGGVAAGINTDIEFCSESPNSIYLNYGASGTDLFLGNTSQSSIIIDTLTVLHPNRYFVVYRADVPQDFNLIVNHGKIEPIPADLYVSPCGSDTNSGLTPAEPLQTIALAMIKILPDSLQQRTVHVAEGIYSRSANNQVFPVVPRPYINLEGADQATTIFDLEEETTAILSHYNTGHHFPGTDQSPYLGYYTIKNFTFINASNSMGVSHGAMYFYFNRSFRLENIEINNCHTGNSEFIEDGRQALAMYHSDEITIRNLHIYDSSGQEAVRITSDRGNAQTLYAENIRIRNNIPGPLNQWYSGGDGGGMIIGTGHTTELVPLYATLINIEITDCIIDNIDPFWGQPPFSHLTAAAPSGKVRIINATVGNNYTGSVSGSGLKLASAIDSELINSIVYGNTPYNLSLLNIRPEPANVYISHSLIEGGQEGILYYSNPNVNVFWGEGNLDTDPLWIGETDPDYSGYYPYRLSENSPARNAGTLDIPDFEFPEYDLAGNPRIYGESIDLGAYEWNHLSIDDHYDFPEDLTFHDYKLCNYPNPVTGLRGMGPGRGVGTTISFNMPQEGEATVDIYNLKGQFVKRLFDAKIPAGKHEVLWTGRNEQGWVVASGFYMYRLLVNGKQVAAGRCTFIK